MAPTVILLHECGHYFVANAFGLTPSFHFAEIRVTLPQPCPPHVLRLGVGAGPAVEASLALGGLFWLWHRRRHRLTSSVTPADWIATYPALCAARWLRCLYGTPAQPVPKDEAMLSASFGFPPWLLPYLLAPAALMLLILTIRLHPRGNRLIPFLPVFLGLFLGAFLWLKMVGPWLLP
ncbi:MAG TPA: hypothetical protein VK815_01205 [Candidatus Acidoferrales bacterium]|nr:hypothetical protein [Candidatus Acidoferrales bacterium]